MSHGDSHGQSRSESRVQSERFSGWIVVGAAFTVLFVVYGIQFSYGTLVDDVATDTGWDKSRVQLIFALYVLAYSALSAVSGALTDRLGPRPVVAGGAVLLTFGYLVWAIAPNLWFVLIGLGVIAPIGMSASWVPCNATVVRWFVERRGLALAIAMSGGSLANVIVPPISAWLVDRWGWRGALGSMAAVGGAIMLAASAVFYRDPESLGQRPDGAKAAPARAAARSAPRSEVGLSPAQATRTSTYWVLLSMYAVSFLVVFVPFVHIRDFAASLGVTTVTASTAISAIGIGALIGRLAAGPVSDRVGRKPVVVAAFATEVAAFTLMSAAGGLALVYPASALFGFSYGATVTLLPALVGDYFGRAHAGAIVGRVFATAGSLAAIGPYVAQLMVDATGSYRSTFALAAAANAAAVLLAASRLPSKVATSQVQSASRAR